MSTSITEKNLATATAYFTAIRKQDFTSLEKCVHPNIHFIGPALSLKDKGTFLTAATSCAALITNLTIREKFASEDQVMLVYNCDCSLAPETLRAAALMTFQNDLITKLELFFDASPFKIK